MDDSVIFGIKCNGVSINASQISIEDDQSKYDYICNVSLKKFWNGNGTYDVSIINKDFIQGMPVGKWRIKEAWISFSWGDSTARLIMEDENGVETYDIEADTQKGSASGSGFDIASFARTIFTKAQEIVRDYPNAEIFNALMELKKSQISSYLINKHKEVSNKSNEEYINFFESASSEISKYLKAFKATENLLDKSDDLRSKQLLKNIKSDCRKLLDSFINAPIK